MDARQAYIDAADRMDAANEDFDAAMAAGDADIIGECAYECYAAHCELVTAKRAAGL